MQSYLEVYLKTKEGLTLWKTKNIDITSQNLLKNIFILSNDLAEHFETCHDNLIRQNIRKLQKEKYLPERLLNFKESYLIANFSFDFLLWYSYLLYFLTMLKFLIKFSEPEISSSKSFLTILGFALDIILTKTYLIIVWLPLDLFLF